MKTLDRLLIVGCLVLTALVAFGSTPALARTEQPSVSAPSAVALQEEPPAGDPVAEVGLLDVAFLIAAVAFFKARFPTISGNAALGLAIAIGAVLAFAPLIAESLPLASPWLMILVNFIKLVIGGAGAFDAIVDIGGKIKTFKAT